MAAFSNFMSFYHRGSNHRGRSDCLLCTTRGHYWFKYDALSDTHVTSDRWMLIFACWLLIQSRVSVLWNQFCKTRRQLSLPLDFDSLQSSLYDSNGAWLYFTKWFPDCYDEPSTYKTVETQEALFRTTHTLTDDYTKAEYF